MVREETKSLSNCSSDESDVSEENSSLASSEDGNNLELAISREGNAENLTFGNVAVTNSTDVHLGPKITINQYFESSNGDLIENNDNKLAIKDLGVLPSVSVRVGYKDNLAFVSDTNGINNVNKEIISSNAQQAEVKKGTHWQRFQNFSIQHLTLAISLGVILLVSLVTLMSVLLTRHPGTTAEYPIDTDEQLSGSPADYPIDANTTNDYVSRDSWRAEPPKQGRNYLKTPVPYVIIMHTASENCTTLAICSQTVKSIQSYHMNDIGWSDIGYNFLVGGDINVYEGRGWHYQGAHTKRYNQKSIGIAFIGSFNAYMPSKEQIELGQQLIREGVELGYIDKAYKLFAAKQLTATQSPGLLLYENVKTWPHWAEKP